MKTEKCPFCQEEIPEDASFCPICFNVLTSAPVPSIAKKSSGMLKKILLSVALILLLGLIVMTIIFLHNKPAKNTLSGKILPTDAITPYVTPETTLVPTFSLDILPEISPMIEVTPSVTSTPLPGLSSVVLSTRTPATVTPSTTATPTNRPTTTVKPTATATNKPTATPTAEPSAVSEVNEALWSYEGSTITAYTGTEAEVTIPETLGGVKITALGDEAFYQNSRIEKVTIPSNITVIGKNVFYMCSNLNTVIMADSVTETDTGVFSYCRNLKTVKLSSGLKKINDQLFSQCSSLENIDIPSSVEEIGKVFGGTAIKSIHIPSKVKIISSEAFCYATDLSKFSVSSDNEYFYTIDDVLYSTSMIVNGEVRQVTSKLHSYPRGKIDTTYTVPDGVTEIGGYAFNGNKHIETVYLAESTIVINTSAFKGCTSLKMVNTNKNLVTVSMSAFASCTNLEEIYLPPKTNYIYFTAFDYCNKLVLHVNGSSYAHNFAVENGLNYRLVS